METEEPNSNIVDLEIKITYLEETVQEINKVVFRQQRAIDQLQQDKKLLIERLKSLEENSKSADIPNEKPPHY